MTELQTAKNSAQRITDGGTSISNDMYDLDPVLSF